MNCPQCNNGLYTTRMRKDRSGYPTFTLHCPEHGDIGEKGFKQDFRSTIIPRRMLSTWTELIAAIVQEAAGNPLGYDQLRRHIALGNLADYVIGVRAGLENCRASGGVRSHMEIGQCYGCDARCLHALGYRLTSIQGFTPPLGEERAVAIIGTWLDRTPIF